MFYLYLSEVVAIALLSKGSKLDPGHRQLYVWVTQLW